MRIMVTGVFDLFHWGHINIIKKAKDYGDGNNTVVVGLFSDDQTLYYKRNPIQTMEERKRNVEACKYVDEVFLDAPLKITHETVKKYNCDMIAGIKCTCGNEEHDSEYDSVKDIFICFEYTSGVSTTELIKRCYDRYLTTNPT